jgi:hypothetical protein
MSSVRTQSPLCLVWNKLDSVFQLSHSPAGTSKQANCCHAGVHRGGGGGRGDATAQVHVRWEHHMRHPTWRH